MTTGVRHTRLLKYDLDHILRACFNASMTRRSMLAGGLPFLIPAASSAQDAISHSAESIHQEPLFAAGARRVYEALADPKQFDKVVRLSGAMQGGMPPGAKPTEIARDAGGAFTLFGGRIVGRHIELVPNQRIVQAWRVVDWSPGLYSIARFELTAQGSNTRIFFDHTGFPKGDAQHLAEGWTANYWEPLRKFLATNG
jgi:activator of HSP90 ATPase